MKQHPSSFWDRHPWTGFLIFVLTMSGVGGALWFLVEERPHYRNPVELSTQERGAFPQDAPWRDDPVHAAVFVHVTGRRGEACEGVETVLVERAQDIVIARGWTQRDGISHLPVPERFAQSLFQRGLDVSAVVPGQIQTAFERVVPAERGRSDVRIRVLDTVTALVRVVTPAGAILPIAGQVFISAPGKTPPVRSGGHPLVDGKARVGGVSTGRPMEINVRAPGFADARTILTIPGDTTISFGVEVNAGARTEEPGR